MWQVVVPIKDWDTAKSRLELPAGTRRRLVQAMAADTLAALAHCSDVNTVTVLVRDQCLLGSAVLRGVDDVVVQPEAAAGLNAALEWFVTASGAPLSPIAIVVADLPALRAESVAAALRDAQQHPFAMVADNDGTGTTVLTALMPADLSPCFGAASASAHAAAGATLVSSSPDVAYDVDTVADLAVASRLGVGPASASILSEPSVQSRLRSPA